MVTEHALEKTSGVLVDPAAGLAVIRLEVPLEVRKPKIALSRVPDNRKLRPTACYTVTSLPTCLYKGFEPPKGACH